MAEGRRGGVPKQGDAMSSRCFVCFKGNPSAQPHTRGIWGAIDGCWGVAAGGTLIVAGASGCQALVSRQLSSSFGLPNSPDRVPSLSRSCQTKSCAQCSWLTVLSDVCAVGYVSQPGDVPGDSAINGVGNKAAVPSCVDCAVKCDMEPACLSYECSPTTLSCNLNTEFAPTAAQIGDYAFCSKWSMPLPWHLRRKWDGAEGNMGSRLYECPGPPSRGASYRGAGGI